MHTIPDKLNALRHSIEASVQGQILDTRLHFEKQLKDATSAAETSAYGRAVQDLVPQLQSVEARINEELPKVKTQLDEAVNLCQKIADSVNVGSQARIQKLDVEIAGFRVELPPIRDHIQHNAESLQQLATFPPELRRVLDETRADLERVAAELRSDLEKEKRRAEWAEGALSGQIHKNEQTASSSLTETRSVLQQTRDQVISAMEQTSIVEDRLHGKLNDFSERAADVSKQHATEVTTGLRPEIQQTVKDAKRHIDDYREVVDTRIATLEAKLREELKTAIEVAAREGEDRLEEKEEVLSKGMSLGLAEIRRDTAGLREALRLGLTNTSAEIFLRIDSDRASAEARCNQLQDGINATEAHFLSLLEKDLPKILERQKHFDDALAAAREESVEARDKLREHLEALQQELAISFEQKSAELHQEQQEARAYAEQELQKTAESLRKDLHTEFMDGLLQAKQRLEDLRTEVNDALAGEVAERRSSLKAVDESVRQHFKDSIEDVRLALMTPITAVDGRVAAAEQRHESLVAVVATQREALEAQVRKQREDTERLEAQLKAAGLRTASLEAWTQKSLDDLGRRLEDHLAHEAANLWAEISRVRSANQGDIEKMRADIPLWATKEDVAEVNKLAKFAISETKEAQLHIGAAEKAIDRHREFWESQARNLATRCDEVEGAVSGIKLRIHQETCVLGTELSQLRCAATSLTHGVLTALQVIGFLHEDLLNQPRAALPPVSTSPTGGSSPRRRLGIDVSDLLEWEKAGKSLAVRVAQRWNAFEPAGTSSLLSLVSRKAEENEVRRLRACLTAAVPFPKTPISGKPWTPSTTAGSFHYENSPVDDFHGPLWESEIEFQPVPPSVEPGHLASPKRPGLSSRQGAGRLRQ